MDLTAILLIVFGTLFISILITMISLLCLRFMNGVWEWGEKREDKQPSRGKGSYQKVESSPITAVRKSKRPEALVTIHTIQPYEKIRREEESDIPYSEESEDDIEFLRPAQRTISPKENLGKLYFSLQYHHGFKLLAKVLRAEELPEARHELPTAYVTASILPCAKDKTQELKSNIQKGCCPIFNDCLEFDTSEMDILGKYIRFVVWYVDSYSQGECLGVVEQDLTVMKNTHRASKRDAETVICRGIQRISQDLQDCDETGSQGTVLCSVTYIPTTNRLTVVLFKAENIRLVSDDNQGVYGEITIVPFKYNKRKRKLTSTVTGTNNPIYNEAILFDLGELDVAQIRLQMTLKQKRTDKLDKAIGRVLMGCDVCDSRAKRHWIDAINANKPVAQWHNLRHCNSFNYASRRRLRSRLSNSENENFEQASNSSSSDD